MSSYYEKMLATGEVKCIDEEIPFEIPQGWEWCRLRDLCTVFGRIGFRGYTRNDIVEKGFGAITLSPSNMQDNGNMNYSVVSYISWKKYEESPEIKVKANDVLIVKTGSSFGKTCIISDLPEKATINPQIAVLKYSFVNNQWLTYFLNAPFAQEQFRKYVIGTSIPTFSQEKLSSTLLPLPPKNEQEHLIKKLSLLGKCIGSYNVIQQLIDRLNVDIYDKLKKSIFQEAILGKLVPQTAEEGTAKELLEQIKAEKQKLVKEGKLKKSALNDSIIFRGDDNRYYEKIGKSVQCIDEEIPFEIPGNWVWVRLGNIVDFSKSQSLPSSSIKESTWVLDLEDIEKDSGILLRKKRMKDVLSKSDKHIFYKGNVLYSKLRPYLNKVIIADEDGACTTEILAFDFGYIYNKYAQLFLMSPFFVDYATADSYGIKMPRLGSKRGNSALMPLPPLKEQQRIVAQIEKLFKQFG